MKVQSENTEGLMLMQKMLEEKRLAVSSSRRSWFWSLLSLLLLCVAGLVSTRWGVFLVIGFVAFIGFFFISVVCLSAVPEPRLSMEEYKNLPGAVNARLAHACLQCGHHGIHRRTVYQTSTTLADCSACQAPLWAG